MLTHLLYITIGIVFIIVYFGIGMALTLFIERYFKLELGHYDLAFIWCLWPILVIGAAVVGSICYILYLSGNPFGKLLNLYKRIRGPIH